ncbi:hypothetical protein DM860_014664 [Cuscuta australis]|uniref:Uncharacterized protein n=1 Tax=Cuscuta australis TaxID=267555 RepID=A0A328DIA6_9ASTE|nr:hypothetical protein DM860_014664 [Cuscuta australis]
MPRTLQTGIPVGRELPEGNHRAAGDEGDVEGRVPRRGSGVGSERRRISKGSSTKIVLGSEGYTLRSSVCNPSMSNLCVDFTVRKQYATATRSELRSDEQSLCRFQREEESAISAIPKSLCDAPKVRNRWDSDF